MCKGEQLRHLSDLTADPVHAVELAKEVLLHSEGDAYSTEECGTVAAFCMSGGPSVPGTFVRTWQSSQIDLGVGERISADTHIGDVVVVVVVVFSRMDVVTPRTDGDFRACLCCWFVLCLRLAAEVDSIFLVV